MQNKFITCSKAGPATSIDGNDLFKRTAGFFTLVCKSTHIHTTDRIAFLIKNLRSVAGAIAFVDRVQGLNARRILFLFFPLNLRIKFLYSFTFLDLF